MRVEMHNGRRAQQETILEQAVERLNAGDDLNAVLSSVGADAEWLEPLLVVATEVRELREVVPVPSAEASLARFLSEAGRIASDLPTASAPGRWWQRVADSLRLMGRGVAVPRLARSALSVMLVAIAFTLAGALFLGADSTAAAQNTLPGQPLYPVKRLGEQIYLWLPQSEGSRNA